MIVDRTDAQATQREPARSGPRGRDRLADQGVGDPIETHPGVATTAEEVGITAAEEVETQIERRRAELLEHGAGDQAVAAAIDDGYGARDIIGRTERGMIPQALHPPILERRPYRTADDVGLSCLSRVNHQVEPAGRGDLIVVDHQEVPGLWKHGQCRLEGRVDGLAITLARLCEAVAREPCAE